MKKLIPILLIMASCNTSKHIDTSSKSEKKEINVDSLVHNKVDSVKVKYEEQRRQMEGSIEFYQDNEKTMNEVIQELQGVLYDSSITNDSLRKLIASVKCPQNKVTYHADGSLEVSGNIKSLKGTISELQKKLDSVTTKKDDNTALKKTDATENKEEAKEVDKKVKSFRWLFWITAAYAFGCVLPPPKLYHFAINKVIPFFRNI